MRILGIDPGVAIVGFGVVDSEGGTQRIEKCHTAKKQEYHIEDGHHNINNVKATTGKKSVKTACAESRRLVKADADGLGALFPESVLSKPMASNETRLPTLQGKDLFFGSFE